MIKHQVQDLPVFQPVHVSTPTDRSPISPAWPLQTPTDRASPSRGRFTPQDAPTPGDKRPDVKHVGAPAPTPADFNGVSTRVDCNTAGHGYTGGVPDSTSIETRADSNPTPVCRNAARAPTDTKTTQRSNDLKERPKTDTTSDLKAENSHSMGRDTFVDNMIVAAVVKEDATAKEDESATTRHNKAPISKDVVPEASMIDVTRAKFEKSETPASLVAKLEIRINNVNDRAPTPITRVRPEHQVARLECVSSTGNDSPKCNSPKNFLRKSGHLEPTPHTICKDPKHGYPDSPEKHPGMQVKVYRRLRSRTESSRESSYESIPISLSQLASCRSHSPGKLGMPVELSEYLPEGLTLQMEAPDRPIRSRQGSRDGFGGNSTDAHVVLDQKHTHWNRKPNYIYQQRKMRGSKISYRGSDGHRVSAHGAGFMARSGSQLLNPSVEQLEKQFSAILAGNFPINSLSPKNQNRSSNRASPQHFGHSSRRWLRSRGSPNQRKSIKEEQHCRGLEGTTWSPGRPSRHEIFMDSSPVIRAELSRMEGEEDSKREHQHSIDAKMLKASLQQADLEESRIAKDSQVKDFMDVDNNLIKGDSMMKDESLMMKESSLLHTDSLMKPSIEMSLDDASLRAASLEMKRPATTGATLHSFHQSLFLATNLMGDRRMGGRRSATPGQIRKRKMKDKRGETKKIGGTKVVEFVSFSSTGKEAPEVVFVKKHANDIKSSLSANAIKQDILAGRPSSLFANQSLFVNQDSSIYSSTAGGGLNAASIHRQSRAREFSPPLQDTNNNLGSSHFSPAYASLENSKKGVELKWTKRDSEVSVEGDKTVGYEQGDGAAASGVEKEGSKLSLKHKSKPSIISAPAMRPEESTMTFVSSMIPEEGSKLREMSHDKPSTAAGNAVPANGERSLDEKPLEDGRPKSRGDKRPVQQKMNTLGLKKPSTAPSYSQWPSTGNVILPPIQDEKINLPAKMRKRPDDSLYKRVEASLKKNTKTEKENQNPTEFADQNATGKGNVPTAAVRDAATKESVRIPHPVLNLNNPSLELNIEGGIKEEEVESGVAETQIEPGNPFPAEARIVKPKRSRKNGTLIGGQKLSQLNSSMKNQYLLGDSTASVFAHRGIEQRTVRHGLDPNALRTFGYNKSFLKMRRSSVQTLDYKLRRSLEHGNISLTDYRRFRGFATGFAVQQRHPMGRPTSQHALDRCAYDYAIIAGDLGDSTQMFSNGEVRETSPAERRPETVDAPLVQKRDKQGKIHHGRPSTTATAGSSMLDRKQKDFAQAAQADLFAGEQDLFVVKQDSLYRQGDNFTGGLSIDMVDVSGMKQPSAQRLKEFSFERPQHSFDRPQDDSSLDRPQSKEFGLDKPQSEEQMRRPSREGLRDSVNRDGMSLVASLGSHQDSKRSFAVSIDLPQEGLAKDGDAGETLDIYQPSAPVDARERHVKGEATAQQVESEATEQQVEGEATAQQVEGEATAKQQAQGEATVDTTKSAKEKGTTGADTATEKERRKKTIGEEEVGRPIYICPEHSVEDVPKDADAPENLGAFDGGSRQQLDAFDNGSHQWEILIGPDATVREESSVSNTISLNNAKTVAFNATAVSRADDGDEDMFPPHLPEEPMPKHSPSTFTRSIIECADDESSNASGSHASAASARMPATFVSDNFLRAAFNRCQQDGQGGELLGDGGFHTAIRNDSVPEDQSVSLMNTVNINDPKVGEKARQGTPLRKIRRESSWQESIPVDKELLRRKPALVRAVTPISTAIIAEEKRKWSPSVSKQMGSKILAEGSKTLLEGSSIAPVLTPRASQHLSRQHSQQAASQQLSGAETASRYLSQDSSFSVIFDGRLEGEHLQGQREQRGEEQDEPQQQIELSQEARSKTLPFRQGDWKPLSPSKDYRAMGKKLDAKNYYVGESSVEQSKQGIHQTKQSIESNKQSIEPSMAEQARESKAKQALEKKRPGVDLKKGEEIGFVDGMSTTLEEDPTLEATLDGTMKSGTQKTLDGNRKSASDAHKNPERSRKDLPHQNELDGTLTSLSATLDLEGSATDTGTVINEDEIADVTAIDQMPNPLVVTKDNPREGGIREDSMRVKDEKEGVNDRDVNRQRAEDGDKNRQVVERSNWWIGKMNEMNRENERKFAEIHENVMPHDAFSVMPSIMANTDFNTSSNPSSAQDGDSHPGELIRPPPPSSIDATSQLGSRHMGSRENFSRSSNSKMVNGALQRNRDMEGAYDFLVQQANQRKHVDRMQQNNLTPLVTGVAEVDGQIMAGPQLGGQISERRVSKYVNHGRIRGKALTSFQLRAQELGAARASTSHTNRNAFGNQRPGRVMSPNGVVASGAPRTSQRWNAPAFEHKSPVKDKDLDRLSKHFDQLYVGIGPPPGTAPGSAGVSRM